MRQMPVSERSLFYKYIFDQKRHIVMVRDKTGQQDA